MHLSLLVTLHSPFAGSILTAESVAVYTSTSPSQHNYSIQKFVPKIRCMCATVCGCECVWVYVCVLQCSSCTLLSLFLAGHTSICLVAFFIYASCCFICSPFVLVFYWHFRGCVPACALKWRVTVYACVCVYLRVCVRDCNLPCQPLVLFRTLEYSVKRETKKCNAMLQLQLQRGLGSLLRRCRKTWSVWTKSK